MEHRKLVLNLDTNKMTWRQYKSFVGLVKRLSSIDQNNADELIPVIEEILVGFSDWSIDEIETLPVEELFNVFKTLKGEEVNSPPLEKSPN